MVQRLHVWWCPQRDLNPCCRLERPASWARLDDRDNIAVREREEGMVTKGPNRVKRRNAWQTTFVLPGTTATIARGCAVPAGVRWGTGAWRQQQVCTHKMKRVCGWVNKPDSVPC